MNNDKIYPTMVIRSQAEAIKLQKKEIDRLNKEVERLNNIINECSDDILKEIKENHHLSYGVALSIRNKLLDYKELKENK